MDKRYTLTRRAALRHGLLIPAALALAGCDAIREAFRASSSTGVSEPAALAPTPACGDADDVTPPQTAGPFYTPNSPERTSLIEPGMPGTPMTLTGLVLTTGCQPIAGALLDFWHADDSGVYDNAGYRLRGHQFTGAEGRFTLETIVPGLYPGRTRHIHVIVQPPNQPALTTQLYFPGEPGNANDGLYNPELLVGMDADNNATFNFVLGV